MKNALESIQVTLLALTLGIMCICLFPLAFLLVTGKTLLAPIMPKRTGESSDI